ncbi:MAG: response regulator transcription factor [Cytophagales bacterium]|nr:response regulator transcription factor [Cytophagales bacterium]
MKEILLIEDDKTIAAHVSAHLTPVHRLTVVHRGREGITRALQGGYDLIILDLVLPDLDGFEVCRQIRAQDSLTPIMILSGRSEEVDKVLGLEFGADDYVTKPFSPRELLARIKAMMRRSELLKHPAGTGEQAELHIAGLRIDPVKRLVLLHGRPLTLTAKEFDLLYTLAGKPGRSYSRRELLRSVWGYQSDGYEHTVTAHVNRLRTKIESDPANPRYILTVWGIGYRFADEE